MGCFTDMCKFYLMFLNTLFGLCGLAVIGISIYILVEGTSLFGFNAETVGFPTWWGWIPLGVGIAITILSIIACMCTKEGNVFLICTFGLIEFVFGSIIVVCGVLILQIADTTMGQIAATPAASQSFGVPSSLFGIGVPLATYCLGLYTGCCSPTIPFSKCGTPQVGPCYPSDHESQYAAGYSSGVVDVNTIPPVSNSNVCAPIGGCAGGLIPWLNELHSFAKSSAYPASIALIAFGSILLFAFIGTCVVGCHHHRNGKTPKKQTTTTTTTTGQNIAYA